MILVAKNFSLMSAGESDRFITDEDLEFINSDPIVRDEFLKSLGTDMLEVNLIIIKDGAVVDNQTKITSPPKVKWGCSHSIGGGKVNV